MKLAKAKRIVLSVERHLEVAGIRLLAQEASDAYAEAVQAVQTAASKMQMMAAASETVQRQYGIDPNKHYQFEHDEVAKTVTWTLLDPPKPIAEPDQLAEVG